MNNLSKTIKTMDDFTEDYEIGWTNDCPFNFGRCISPIEGHPEDCDNIHALTWGCPYRPQEERKLTIIEES